MSRDVGTPEPEGIAFRSPWSLDPCTCRGGCSHTAEHLAPWKRCRCVCHRCPVGSCQLRVGHQGEHL